MCPIKLKRPPGFGCWLPTVCWRVFVPVLVIFETVFTLERTYHAPARCGDYA